MQILLKQNIFILRELGLFVRFCHIYLEKKAQINLLNTVTGYDVQPATPHPNERPPLVRLFLPADAAHQLD